MNDQELVALYWARDDRAIEATAARYGGYCLAIARNILSSQEDAEECVNDTWLHAWNSMPPHRPLSLPGFLGKLCRYAALKRWRDQRAQKRGGGEVALAYEELSDCIPGRGGPEEELEGRALGQLVQAFVTGLPAVERRIFLCRYWYFDSIAEIAQQFGFSQSKVKSLLFRLRGRLREELKKEGFSV